MDNLMDFKAHSASLNEKTEGPSAFQKFLQNIEDKGDQLAYSKSDDDLRSNFDATLGRILGSISRGAQKIAKDFGMDWVEPNKPYRYYRNNRKSHVDRWETENLVKGKKYNDAELEKVYNEFQEKGRKRFGERYDFARPGNNEDEKLFSEYAREIMKRYTKTRS